MKVGYEDKKGRKEGRGGGSIVIKKEKQEDEGGNVEGLRKRI